MRDPKRLETPEHLEYRQQFKDDLTRMDRVTATEVISAATQIYQSEFGHWIDDGHAADELWQDASELYAEHSGQAKDIGELVDLIVRGLHGANPTAFELADAYGPETPLGDF